MDDFTFTGLNGLTEGTYKLITSNALNGTLDPSKLAGTLGGFTATLRQNGGDLELVLTTPLFFASWQSINGTSGGMADDHDNDGVPNGVEYFLGGPTGNTTGQTVLPPLIDISGTLSITWTGGPGLIGTYGTDFVIETSSNPGGTWSNETLGVNVTASGNSFTYTFPAGIRRFARLKVMSP
jgi:hypothetical protein